MSDDAILRALHEWCDHHDADRWQPGGCGLRHTRYDNCRCEQQCGSVREAIESQRPWPRLKAVLRGWLT